MKQGRVVFYLFLSLVLQAPWAHADDSSLAASRREFVQKFYDAYVPQALAERTTPASQFAIDQLSASFDGDLLAALKDDAAAQAKSSDEVVGLDFDPFLNSQDPAERYEVGSATQAGTKYLVDVYAVTSGKRSQEPAVIAEVEQKNGQWRFVNFRYPGNDDLLTVLRTLKESRESPQN